MRKILQILATVALLVGVFGVLPAQTQARITRAMVAGANSVIGWSGLSLMTSPSNGVIAFLDNAQTSFSIHCLGPATSGSPGWKRAASTFQARLCDDSANTDVAAADFYPSNAAITAGSGTGITVNGVGSGRTLVYKVTIATTAFICAAVTCDVTIATLPAKTFVSHTLADLTVAFTCASVCTSSTLSATLGKTAGGNQYLLSWDLDAATGQFGDAAAELGASLAPATVPTENGDIANWTSTTTVVLRLTSGTGNVGTGAATNLGVGSVTFYLTTVKMP